MTRFARFLRRAVDGDDDARSAAARDEATWRALSPLSIGDPPPATPPLPPVAPTALVTDGVERFAGVVDEDALADARAAVAAVERAGWPLVFAFVYDALWRVLSSPGVRAVVDGALGAGAHRLPPVWVHKVAAVGGARGWHPHVDLAGPARLLADGRPERLNGWIPLTDATIDNGCIFAVPAGVASSVTTRWDRVRAVPVDDVVRLLHAARPLPAAAGALLLWRPDILHWGGVATGASTTPRIALSFEVAHPAVHAEAAPEWPSFDERLSLVGRALVAYGGASDREPVAARFVGVGRKLAG